MSHNNQKKIAVINDFSGFGRCSIAVALPILSVMKVQCCPLPTSIFSNHTGFPSYFFEDYTSRMVPYMQEWKKLDLHFNGICSGFLGSKEQIEIVKKFFKEFKTEETQIIVDPVMGDYGKPYPTYTEEMCGEMKKLVEFADILTPNVTEACVLTDTPYKEKWKIEEIQEMAEKIHKMGPKNHRYRPGRIYCKLLLRRRAAAESAAYPQRRNTAFRNRRYLCIHHRSRCRQRSAVL